MKKIATKKLVFGIGGVAVGLLIALLPPPALLSVESMRYLGLLVWFISWMVGGVLPEFLTGLAFLSLAVVLGLTDFTTAFSPFAGSTVWLLVGAFGIGSMLGKTGVLRRIAYAIMQLFPGSYTGQLLALYVAGIVVSPLVPSMTAKVALISPLAVPVSEAFGFERNSKGALGLFMSSYWSAGILGNFFFTGSIYVGLMIGYLDADTAALMNFGSWFRFFWPYFLVFAAGGFFMIRLLCRPKDCQPLPPDFFKQRLQALGPMSRDEKLSLAVLVIVVMGWLTAAQTGISITTWSVIGLVLLGATGILKPADFNTAIPWPMLALVTAIYTLTMLMDTYGIPAWLTVVISPLLGPVASSQALLLVAVGFTVFALRWGVASMFTSGALVYALFNGLGVALGMNPLLIVFVDFMGVQCWPFAAYNVTLLTGVNSVTELLDFAPVRKFTFVYSALVIVAALANLPIWRAVGFC